MHAPAFAGALSGGFEPVSHSRAHLIENFLPWQHRGALECFHVRVRADGRFRLLHWGLSGLSLSHRIRSGRLLPELFGEPDENSFGTPNVAEPVRVFILDHFADEFRAAFSEPGERI